MKYQDLLNKYNLKPWCSGGIGEGWVPLVEELIIKLIDIGWDKQVSQIKEKFGQLRFYVGGGTEEMFDLINEYERKSGKTCEDCGKPGEVRVERSWMLTLCDECDKKDA